MRLLWIYTLALTIVLALVFQSANGDAMHKKGQENRGIIHGKNDQPRRKHPDIGRNDRHSSTGDRSSSHSRNRGHSSSSDRLNDRSSHHDRKNKDKKQHKNKHNKHRDEKKHRGGKMPHH